MLNLFTNLSVTSLAFFVFILFVFVCYYISFKKHQNLILLLGSYTFCITWGLPFFIPLVFYSIINYRLAIKIADATSNKKYFLWLGIGLNLTGLLFYKYFDSIEYIVSRGLPRLGISYEIIFPNIILPIGISFYILQAISYLVDVYRGQIPANKNFIETSLYLSYFPKLLAGPIERAGNFFKQLQTTQEINNQSIIEGSVKILVGLTRKVLIAETIMAIIPPNLFIQPADYSASNLLIWWFLFAIVIYNDFAGYSSIAQGVSKLFGIELSQNFQQPFLSTSFIDFWNRWHISLSNWLRDYIYLPVSRWMLYKNSSGKYIPNLIVPPLITMFISGLWHGAALHFILWGILNGALQGIERVYKSRKKISKEQPSRIKQILNVSGLFLILVMMNVPFKFDVSQTFDVWKNLITFRDLGNVISISMIIKPIAAICLSFIIDFLQLPKNTEEKLFRLPQTVRVFALAFVLLLLFLASLQQSLTPFIYQEF